jgi:hypothetical protein
LSRATNEQVKRASELQVFRPDLVLRYLRGTITRRLFFPRSGSFNSKPTLMLPGLATLTVALFLPIVFFLVVLSLFGRLRSRPRYLVRVPRWSCKLWLLRRQKLLGSDGYLRILVFQFLYPLLFCLSIARDPVKHELTKHIGVDAYYTRAQVQDDVIALRYVPSEL